MESKEVAKTSTPLGLQLMTFVDVRSNSVFQSPIVAQVLRFQPTQRIRPACYSEFHRKRARLTLVCPMSICTAVNYSALAAAISMFPFVARMMILKAHSKQRSSRAKANGGAKQLNHGRELCCRYSLLRRPRRLIFQRRQRIAANKYLCPTRGAIYRHFI